MKIKIKYIIATIILPCVGFLYLKSWYIYLTHFKYFGMNLDTILNPFTVDESGIFVYEIATNNTFLFVVFWTVNALILLIIIVLMIDFIDEKEIIIGEK